MLMIWKDEQPFSLIENDGFLKPFLLKVTALHYNISSKTPVTRWLNEKSSRVRDHISNIRRPLRDDEISPLVNYGSEEESGEEDEGITQSIVLPRVARMFMDQEDEEVEEACNVAMCLFTCYEPYHINF
ncbi:unnamed protein product [Euphydryas editha]|uniref:Uncharacterized protein n=1 Tax=Euphydryas editha TaxID=104508 RepID=A0AAU9VD40_EUPED|nr:unnamed protein product [Euphydryas editha]